jgi:cytidylate kinase
MIITIDGPAGSGKSTIAKKVASHLNFEYFDTGAIYRSVTWHLIKEKVNIKDEEEIKKSLHLFSFEIEDSNERKYLVDGQDVTVLIRMQDVTEKVSEVSTYGSVRKHVLEIQRNFGRKKSAVFEGRDMGTVVFPYADVKFFLTAKAKVRAQRRYKELKEKFPDLAATFDYDKILSEIIKRDKIDSTRELSPLKKGRDSHLIDTSKMTIDEVIEKIENRIKKYNKRKNIPFPYFSQMSPLYGLVLFIVWIFFKLFYRLKVHGINNFIKGPAMIASNHVSYYDPPAIAVSSMEEVHFLAKESLFRNSCFGWLIKKLNSHPISRGASDVTSFKKVVSLLNKGDKVILFPEGERSGDGKLSKILPGIGLLVYLSKCAVIPTYIFGSYSLWNRTRKIPKIFGKVHVVFGTPISFAQCDHLDKRACMEKVNNLLEEALFKLEKWCEDGFKGTPP